MADEVIIAALDRLQQALDSLESAASAPASVRRDGRDMQLRAEVQAVIAELDRMIGAAHG